MGNSSIAMYNLAGTTVAAVFALISVGYGATTVRDITFSKALMITYCLLTEPSGVWTKRFFVEKRI